MIQKSWGDKDSWNKLEAIIICYNCCMLINEKYSNVAAGSSTEFSRDFDVEVYASVIITNVSNYK